MLSHRAGFVCEVARCLQLVVYLSGNMIPRRNLKDGRMGLRLVYQDSSPERRSFGLRLVPLIPARGRLGFIMGPGSSVPAFDLEIVIRSAASQMMQAFLVLRLTIRLLRPQGRFHPPSASPCIGKDSVLLSGARPFDNKVDAPARKRLRPA